MAVTVCIVLGIAAPAAYAAWNPFPNAASVPGSTYGVYTERTQEWRAYVKAGEKISARFEMFHPDRPGATQSAQTFTIKDQAGAVKWTQTAPANVAQGSVYQSGDLTATTSGVWTIIQAHTNSAQPYAGSKVTISVKNSGGTDIPGRVWTNLYQQYQQSGGPVASASLWAVDDTGLIYKIDMKNFNGVSWGIAGTRAGPTPTNCIPIYRSVPLASNIGVECGLFRLFTEVPATDLPESAPSAAGTILVKPAPLTASTLFSGGVTVTPTSWDPVASTFSYSLNTRFIGAYQIQIDTNNDGVFTDPTDRSIQQYAKGGASNTGLSYAFDGKDGLGAAMAPYQSYRVRILVDKLGEIHFTLGDFEIFGGITVTKVNGPQQGDATIYWDDRSLDNNCSDTGTPKACSSTTPVKDGRAGVNSATAAGVHGWTGADVTSSWGNYRSIDNWAYAKVAFQTEETPVPAPNGPYTLSKESNPADGTQVKPGDVIQYTVTALAGRGLVGGVVISDDLTDVLDNGEIVEGSVSAQIVGGAPIEVDQGENTLSTVPFDLPSGQKATLTYQVRVADDAVGAKLYNLASAADKEMKPPTNCSAANPAACDTTHETRRLLLYLDKIGQVGADADTPLAGSAWNLRADFEGAPGEVLTELPVAPVPDATGQFRIDGLTPGTYWLEEAAAPAGFSLLAEPIKFTIRGDGSVTMDSEVLDAGVAKITDDDGDGIFHIAVRDVPAFMLPATGGSGTWVMWSLGLIVAAGGGAFFVVAMSRRSMESRSEAASTGEGSK